jgi:hypothetical protein
MSSLALAVGALGFSQSPKTRDVIQGSETVRGYRLSSDARAVLDAYGRVLMRLPGVKRKAVPELMGMLQQSADIELFLRRLDDPDPSGGIQFRLEIFRGRRGAEATFVHDFTLDGAFQWIRFFQPPDARDNPAVFIDVNPGSMTLWIYLLAPDRQTMEKLFESNGAGGGEFIDLDGDGVYELIGRAIGGSARCTFHLSPRPGPGTAPEIFVRAGAGYRQVSMPPDLAPSVVDGTFADLRGDGAVELIVLQDGLAEEPAQALAVYRLENKSLRLVAQMSLPPQRLAFLLDTRDSPGGKEILVRTATPAECEVIGANPEEVGTVKAYILRGDRLEPVQP